MKLAIYVNTIREARGAERVVANLAIALAERGHRVSCLLEDPRGWLALKLSETDGVTLVNLRAEELKNKRLAGLYRIGVLTQTLLYAPFSLLTGKNPRVVSTFRLIIKKKPPIYALHNYLKKARPAATLSFLNYPNIVLLLSARFGKYGARIYVSVRNQISMSSAHGKSKWARAVPGLMRSLFGGADGIVAPSHGVAQDVVNITSIAEKKIKVILNPVYRPEIISLADELCGHAWLDGQNARQSARVIIAAGKLRPQKDFPSLIAAFALVREKEPAVRLIILGEGDLRDDLQTLSVELGVAEAIDMPGHVKNPYAYISKASVFVLSSAWEGLPNVLIEALACGTPVVSTDCPSGASEILDGGKHGELVPVGDVERMAERILHTLNNPPPKEDLVNRAKVFSLDKAVAAYEQLLSNS